VYLVKILNFLNIWVQDLKGEKCCESAVLIGRVKYEYLDSFRIVSICIRRMSPHFVEHTAAHLN